MSHDYNEHLEDLRRRYCEAFPKQRIGIASQRIDAGGSDGDPGLIVTYVSVIEGLLRSFVIWNETPTGRPTEKTYKKYKRTTPMKLFEKYLEQKDAEAAAIATPDDIALVEYAVEYRNLLAHECTYLGGDTSKPLIDACRVFLCGLCKHAGHDAPVPPC